MSHSDPLILLRASIKSSKPPQLTTSPSPQDAVSTITDSFATATYLYFSHPTPQCLPLTTTTRFASTDPTTKEITQVDLRSIYFAWTQLEVTVSEYIAKATETDQILPQGQRLRVLVFAERLDLLTWLEGASDHSEHIKPSENIPGEDGAAAKAADIAGGAGVPIASGTGVAVTQQAAGGRPVKVIDARLQAIYAGERKMKDHNSILRGIKPTDFSHVRKHAELFLGRRAKPTPSSRPSKMPARPLPVAKPISSAPQVNAKRSDPIILLSPSASSLLRMSNAKSLLDTGLFVPPDHPTLSSQTTANLLHITRVLPSISPKPLRFILVDSPDNFKPEYWSRVVAVFTTGQTWQFRAYKWREPQELFSHVLGMYIGEKGLPLPSDVKGWGGSVRTFMVERWDERMHGQNVDSAMRENRRWRDREVVEELWRTLEAHMRASGEWRR